MLFQISYKTSPYLYFQIGHEVYTGQVSIPPSSSGWSAGEMKYPSVAFEKLLSSFQDVMASKDAHSSAEKMALKEEVERLKDERLNSVVDIVEAKHAWSWACAIIKEARPDLANQITPSKFWIPKRSVAKQP